MTDDNPTQGGDVDHSQAYAICKTCGGSPGHHVPSQFDPDGIGDPGHRMPTQGGDECKILTPRKLNAINRRRKCKKCHKILYYYREYAVAMAASATDLRGQYNAYRCTKKCCLYSDGATGWHIGHDN